MIPTNEGTVVGTDLVTIIRVDSVNVLGKRANMPCIIVQHKAVCEGLTFLQRLPL